MVKKTVNEQKANIFLSEQMKKISGMEKTKKRKMQSLIMKEYWVIRKGQT